AHLLLLAVAQTAWLAALIFLVRSLTCDGRQALFAIALAVALPSSYGSRGLLGYGGGVLTPRLFAEGFTMAGIGCAARHRIAPALLALASALALHPIAALPGVIAAGGYAVLRDRRWLWLLLGGALLSIGLALLQKEPFARLFETVDPVWLRFIEKRTAPALVTRWTSFDLCQLPAILALAGTGLAGTGERARRFLCIALVLGLGGLAATLLGGDLAHNVFILEIQPWRTLWLLTLAANISAGILLSRLLDCEPGERPLFLWISL